MFHHLLFVMSLSGSVVFILYGLTYPITRRYFPHTWRKSILCFSLFFYLFPVPLLKEFVLSRLKKYFPLRNANYDMIGPLSIDLKYSINIQNKQISLGQEAVAVFVFAFCMAVIAFVVIIKQLRQYGKIHRRYSLKLFCDPAPSQLNELLKKTKEELRVKKPVKLICSRLCDTPMTIGVFSPTIIFPASNKLNLELDDCQYILKHELLHIKSRDLLIKFLALFALAIHWYNPICYLLFHELCAVCELDCDYSVTKNIDETQRQRYGNLILELAAAGNSEKEQFAVGLVNNSTATFERRMLEIKIAKKNSKPLLAYLVIVIIFIMGTIIAFAYEAPTLIELPGFDSLTEYTFSANKEFQEIEHFQYDYFFTSNDGKITGLDGGTPLLECNHDFIEGTTTEHCKNSKGDCVTYEKKGYLCTECGHLKEGEEINQIKYFVCPH